MCLYKYKMHYVEVLARDYKMQILVHLYRFYNHESYYFKVWRVCIILLDYNS